ncbi:NAD-dependent epimerase/dehydratase family protein [Aureimonas leprariae]|uniref:NAD-dependent epimerase/dehydratase family protein n=1 Tax=Plantimonas leprariae TaxID=2615207 RepID=A0A7V7PP26_9HYPH|nr:NAD-dependent epimerase/dehydratase family protein [Aureimonas leprariae]KAB0679704.1 NAD-dependent epimerase/dehydratase family protein [Aureimonas leprariae]
MRYYITGTAGFVGFHLARRLLEEGHDVAGFDGLTSYYDVRLKEARHAALAQFPRFAPTIALLEDQAALRRSMAEAKPDIVIHLAAQAGVRYSLENPRSYVESNVVGTFNLLEIVRELRPRHLLLASTSSVYGANPTVPFREIDKADEPLTIYAATKRACELMAHSTAHLYRVPTTAFRFFTVYGPWGRPDMALFKFVRAILADEEIEIYGEGRMSRDFTYVDDLVEGILRLAALPPDEANRVGAGNELDTLSHQGPYRVVNIGGGQPVGLLELVDAVERALGRKARRRMLPMQDGDVPRTFASPDLLEALTGYRPATNLETGIKAFVDWYREAQASLR